MTKAIVQAAFAVFFVSSVWAEELPRPRAGCIVLEDVLAKVGNAGAPMPEQIVRLPEHPYMVFLIYADRSGVIFKEDENTCIVGKAIFSPVEMEKILPRLQSW